MVKGPGLYSDIGKKTRGYFAKFNYLIISFFVILFLLISHPSHKLLFKTFVQGLSEPPQVHRHHSYCYWNHQRSIKVELQYQNEEVGIGTSLVGLASNPTVNFSGVCGNSNAALGIDLSYDTACGYFIKCNAGLNLTQDDDKSVTLTLNNRGDNITASFCTALDRRTKTVMGGEICMNWYSSESTLTFGIQHALSPTTLMKARMNSHGKFSALIHHDLSPKVRFTMCGEADVRPFERSVKVGLALDPKP